MSEEPKNPATDAEIVSLDARRKAEAAKDDAQGRRVWVDDEGNIRVKTESIEAKISPAEALAGAKKVLADFPTEDVQRSKFIAQTEREKNNYNLVHNPAQYDVLTDNERMEASARFDTIMQSQRDGAVVTDTEILYSIMALHRDYPDHYSVAVLVPTAEEIVSRLQGK